jgi:hypothetical protein
VERKTLTESLQIIMAVWRGLKKDLNMPQKSQSGSSVAADYNMAIFGAFI